MHIYLNKTKRYLIINLILMIPLWGGLVYLYFQQNSFSTVSQAQLTYAGAYLMAIYFLAVFCWLRLTRNVCSFYFIFLLYLFVCNAGQTLLSFFTDPGYKNQYIYHDYTSEEIYKMLIFQGMCVLCLNMGVLIALSFQRKTYEAINAEEPFRHNTLHPNVAGCFYISSAIMLGYACSQFILRMQYSYKDYYDLKEGASIYVQAFFYISVVAYILYNWNVKRKIRMVYWIFAIQMVIYMLVGNRTMLIPLGSTLIVMFIIIHPHYFDSIWKKTALITGALFFLLILSNISSARTSVIGADSIFEFNNVLFTLGEGIHEMGQSAQTVIMTISHVDAGTSKEPTILYNIIIAFIPRGILEFIGFHAPQIGNLSAWVTDLADSTSGYGYSIIAESYFNFGIWGCFFMGLYGFVLIRMEYLCIGLAKQGKVLFPAMLSFILSYQIFLARAQFDLLTSRLRVSLYIIIFWIIFIKKGKIMIRMTRRKRSLN